jgi:hypothetical protein
MTCRPTGFFCGLAPTMTITRSPAAAAGAATHDPRKRFFLAALSVDEALVHDHHRARHHSPRDRRRRPATRLVGRRRHVERRYSLRSSNMFDTDCMDHAGWWDWQKILNADFPAAAGAQRGHVRHVKRLRRVKRPRRGQAAAPQSSGSRQSLACRMLRASCMSLRVVEVVAGCGLCRPDRRSCRDLAEDLILRFL